MTPVTILTGFLGSGKTSLLAALLRTPGFARTAVIINEFGEIGLDHELIEVSDESLVQLTTGCLCCALRGDLAQTLMDLAHRRDAGAVPPFERVVVETSGLADPAPILHALTADAEVAGRYALHAVVTLVDALHGAAALDGHEEARRQVAVADRLLISKTDAAPGTAGLQERLAAMNPSATMGTTRDPGPLDGPATRRPWMEWDRLPRHTEGIGTALILRETPIPGVALALLLQALAAHAGPRLLRVKGLVDVSESPGRPALVHGVQHVFAPPEWLPAWPGPDHRTRIVVIGRAIPVHWPSRLLDAIESEVRDEAAEHTQHRGLP